MNRALLVLASLLLIAGCGTAPPSSSASPSVEPSIELPLDPAVLGLTCGDGHAFHPALLASPGHAETDPDAVAASLRAVIVRRQLPASGWIRVVQVVDRVLFLAPMADGTAFNAVGLQLRDGVWQPELDGRCQPEVVLPAGVGRAEWRLDPAFPQPGVGDRQVHVLINELACASGQSPEGRVLAPIVAPSQTAITIVILVTNQPGGQECPGNPDFPLTVDLPEPIGGRPLLDGAVYPPRDVTKPSSG